ncbi:hypothetical protein FRC12_014821 [Ceratobasidium sp. 428]|nr:hypothetical protein FRC12_014821 [Ceratobasidium sp. 428]
MAYIYGKQLVLNLLGSTAATELVLLNGRVLGVSGFVHRVVSSFGCGLHTTLTRLNGTHQPHPRTLDPDPDQLALVSILGLVVGGFVVGCCRNGLENRLHVQLVDVHTGPMDWQQVTGLAIAGLLVGLGSKLANGCTSGHMLCGVARLSSRSLIASGTFIPAGIATHLLVGRLAPSTLKLEPEAEPEMPSWWMILFLQTPIIVCRYLSLLFKNSLGERFARRMAAFSACFHFALGLSFSGMLRPSKILNFMNLLPSTAQNGDWDPSLVSVVLGGILPQLFIWKYWLGEYVRRPGTQPALCSTWLIPHSPSDWRHAFSARLVFGAVLFGIGWGLRGVCPGPGVVLIGVALGGQSEIWARAGPWVCGLIVGGIFGGMI